MITQSEIQTVRPLFKRGLTYKAISEQTGLSLSRVSSIVRYRIKEKRNDTKRLSTDDKALIESLYERGFNTKQIHIKTGIKQSKAWYYLKTLCLVG
jgi:hypothetical protein